MPARGRPASKNPRLRRIETRINKTTASELKFVCEKAGLNITSVIDKAIHLLCLLTSDSRTSDDTMYAIENISAENFFAENQWDQLFEVLSDINYRFPNIDEDKLSFICEEKNLDSFEETLKYLVDSEYQNIADQYGDKELELWNNIPEPNDEGILEAFEEAELEMRNNFMTYN